MYFKQFYLGCLAHALYLIGSNGEAAVVDPQRDTEQYVSACAAEGLEIKYVIETHLHADFVSGHCELAARTGAEIIFSRHARAAFPHRPVEDGDEINLGRVTLRFMETPGHTPESMCIAVICAGGYRSSAATGILESVAFSTCITSPESPPLISVRATRWKSRRHRSRIPLSFA